MCVPAIIPSKVRYALLALAMGLCACGKPATPPVPRAGAPTPAGEVPVAEAFAEGGNLLVPAKTVIEAIDAGMEILLVDARPPLDFAFSHIPGAINVPYYEPEKHLDRLPRDTWIVTYCECPHAEAEQLADHLLDQGFTKVRVINEGLQGWTDLGGPIEETGSVDPPATTPASTRRH